ncbi:MAG: cation diffusion facilitator family transporter [Candidatus Eiseniibacteriota bacterium]
MHTHGQTKRVLAIVLALNALTCLVEFIAGWWTNSLALLSDAGHMLGDVGALALSFAAASFATRPASTDKTFGYYRSEILAALANGVVLVVIAALVVFEAVRRLSAPPSLEGGTVAAVAAIGLVVNLVSAFVLLGGSRNDLNMRGAFLHAVSDTLGSVGALVAGLLVLGRGWTIADPLASLFISLLVAYAGVRLLGDTVHVLMEGAPARLRVERVREAMENAEGVRAVHDLHVWSVASRFAVLSAHIVTDSALSVAESQRVLAGVRGVLRQEFGVEHVTLQVEPAPEASPDAACAPCEEPGRAAER